MKSSLSGACGFENGSPRVRPERRPFSLAAAPSSSSFTRRTTRQGEDGLGGERLTANLEI